MVHVIRMKNENSRDGYHSVYHCKDKAKAYMDNWQKHHPDMSYYLESTDDYDIIYVPTLRRSKVNMEVKFKDSNGSMFVVEGSLK